jgi:hypothetical protein
MKKYFAVVENRQGHSTGTWNQGSSKPDFQQVESCHRSQSAADRALARQRREHPGVPMEVVECDSMLKFGTKI